MKLLFDAPQKRLQELKKDILSLKARTASSKNEGAYLDLIGILADCYIEKSNNVSKLILSLKNVPPLTVEANLSELKNYVATLSFLIQNVQKSHPLTLPLGTEGLLKDLFSQLTTEKLYFFLNISHSQDYSTQPELFRTIRDQIKNNFKKSVPAECEKNIVNINVFATQVKDTLRHSIFAHEAGHVLVRFDKNYANGLSAIKQLVFPQVQRELQALFAKHPGLTKLDQIEIEDSLVTIFKSWSEEFFVDLISVHALGPAAIYSMKELMLEEIDFSGGMSKTHPAIYKRVLMMWHYLKKCQFDSCIDSTILQNLMSIVDRCRSFIPLQPAKQVYLDLLNLLYDEATLEKMVDCFINCKFPGAYTTTAYSNEVLPLVDYLSMGIAVAELPDSKAKSFKTISGASLINSAWVVEESGKLPTELLNPILNKALANLYLKNNWSKAGM